MDSNSFYENSERMNLAALMAAVYSVPGPGLSVSYFFLFYFSISLFYQ